VVDVTIKTLNVWFNEPAQGGDRPKLLSKLALLELCGWIEGEFDRLVMIVQDGRLNDPGWVNECVISKTSGFAYLEHWRPMLARLVGEVFARRIEQQMEVQFPGELDQLKSLLGSLWKKRCGFAHADINANIAAQQTFDAPSWTLNQHRIVKKILGHYEQVVIHVLANV
jgi:hypothetical protein